MHVGRWVARRAAPAAMAAMAALGLAAGSGPVAAATTPTPSAGDPPAMTTPVQATADDQAATRAYASPYVLVDPRNARNVVAGTVDMRTGTCRLLRSTDSGQAWKLLDALPSPYCFATSGMQTETPMAFGRNGTLYFGMVGGGDQDGGRRGNLSVVLARSNDLGNTWQTAIVRDDRGKVGAEIESDAPASSIAVDTHTGSADIVYFTYHRSTPDDTGPGGNGRRPMLAVSTDGGKSFGDPVDVSSLHAQKVKDPATGNDVAIGMAFDSAQVAVDDKGTLYLLYRANALAAVTPPQPFPVMLARSTDRGRTFTFTEATPPSLYTGHVVSMKWSPHGGPQGTVHVLYEDKPDQPAGSADRDIYYVRSTDRGVTFDRPRLMNDDDPTKLAVQAAPGLGVAPDGRVDAVWWDFRNDPGGFANDVYHAYSDDDGVSWSKNIRVTDQVVGRAVGARSNGADIRQRPGVASTDRLAVVAWDDTRLGDDTTQAHDVFARVVRYRPPGAGNDVARYAIGAVGGLAVAGLLVLVVSMTNRRRAGPTERAGRARPPTAVRRT